jgi:hypothetical protein
VISLLVLSVLTSSPPPEAVRSIPTPELLQLGRESARALGPYRARLTKQERVGGTLRSPEIIDATVRESPKAAVLQYVGGSARGRKVLYDASKKPEKMRVREAGLLSIAGAIWVDVDCSLAKRDTNHLVTDIGFVSLIDLLEKDFTAAGPFGGFTRTDDGLDPRGRWCLSFVAPKGATGLHAATAKICIDVALRLPVLVEVHDADGLLERYEWDAVTPAPDATFDW